MKKRRTIFRTVIMIILPLIIIAEAMVLILAHNYVSKMTYENYENDIENAAKVANELLEFCALKNAEDGILNSVVLSHLCEQLDLPYLYVIEVDEQQSTIKYLCIGTGEGASKEFIDSRHIGDVIPAEINEYIRSALAGKKDHNIEHISNRFGDTLTCYIRRTGEYATNEIVAAEISVDSVMAKLNRVFSFVALITILFTVSQLVILAFIIHRKVQKPAHIISQKMNSFVHDRKEGFEKLEVKGSREFAEMAESFNSMAEEIDRYLNELSKLNRQKAELHIARKIQKGLLEPTEFECLSARINACMLPARDVGGDLYDYIELDNGKICVVIADVSGKGVSAALFMSRAITLLHQYAEAGMSPGKILQEYNNHLADHNPNMLFITTFVAIYDPEANELTYANAGHNPPFIISDSLQRLDGELGMAAGIFKDEAYIEHTVRVGLGDRLFLYTDGVTEAKSLDGKLFSDKALEEILTGLTGSADEEPIQSVSEHLKEFTDGAEQADDITMLTLKILPHTCQRLRLEAKTENLTAIFQAVAQLDLPEETKSQLKFMAEEMFVNICSYAYPDDDGTAEVIIETDKKQAVLTFIDSGLQFDPTQDIPDMESYDIDNRIGGLGRFLTFSFADGYSYKRGAEKNVLRIIKKLH